MREARRIKKRKEPKCPFRWQPEHESPNQEIGIGICAASLYSKRLFLEFHPGN